MKNAKRWLAVLLAVTLLGSNAVYQLGTTLSANEIETVTESQQDESENEVAVQSETQIEDTGQATVQEVTPQEDKSEASVQETATAQELQPAPAAQTQEAQAEAQKPVVVEVPQAEQTPDAEPADAAQMEIQTKTSAVQTYNVKINKPDLDGGQIKVWGADENKVDVTSYDANNQYVKEVTEGEDFHFQITLNDGFTIEKVTDQNDNIINPENTDGNVTTYKLGGVNEEKLVEITYNKAETPAEKEQNNEALTEADVQPNEEIAVQAAGSTRAVGKGITAYVVTSSDDTTYGVNSSKIRYEDTNGKDIKLKSGAIKTFTFGNTIYVNKATFAQPVGVIDGYVFEDAYFFWSGHYSGTKYSATEFYNFGSQVTHYDSNIGFKCTNTTQNTDKDGYFAYNPTGVLHLVYKKVTPDASYNIYYMNGSTQYDKLASTSAWKNGKYVYYFKATQKADPTYPNPQAGHTYTFKGWNTKADGSGEWVQNVYEDGKTEITSDIYLYAIYDDTADINEYVTLTPQDVEKLYDGKTYTSGTATVSAKKDGADLSGIKIKYQKKDGTWTENPKDITAKDVTDSMTVNIRVTSDKYTGELTGTQKLTINPRTVTLTSGSDKKEYDGTPLTKDSVTVSGDGFADGEGADYDVTGTITNVGKEDNTFTYELKKGTKESNYKITPAFGTLEITPCTTKITVTITENSGSEKYDGTEKTVAGYTVTSVSNPAYTEKDFAFTGDEAHKTVSETNAGSYDMGLVSGDFTNNNKNFSNVEFKIVDGKLNIAQRKVTLTSGTDSKTYDGTPLTKAGVIVSGDGFVTGEEPAYNVTGTITEAGSVKNTFTYTFAEGVVKENYDITKVEGTLTVAPIDKVVVTITGKKDSTTYNGKEQNVEDYDVSISNAKYTEKDFTFSGKAIAKGTDAGTYKMGLKASDFKNTNKNFENVEFKVTDGELKINPRKVTMTSGSGEKVYDGNALTNKTVTESDEGFVGNDGATYKVTGSQTNAGESENTFTYKLKDGTNADNYTITTENGKLKVTPVTAEVTVTITENSGKDKYDGTEKTVTGYTVTSISNPAYTEKDFAFTGEEAHKTVSGTNAGTYDMNLEAGDFTNISGNFTNVKFEIKDGTLVIDKRTVTLTSATDEKPYDGQPLENHDVTVGGDGFAEGEGAASYDVTGTQTNVGESDNTFEGYTLNENTLADNYTITTAAGKLKVTPVTDKVTVTIRERSGNDTYDGTEKTVTGYDIVSISNPLYNESDFSFTGEEAHKTVSGIDAGTYNMELKPADFTNNSANFTNVEFVIEDGTLVIAKRNVTLTSASDTKPYDGQPLVNLGVTAEGFVGNDGAAYNVTGTITDVGEKDNEFTYTLNEGTNKDNYEIATVFGKLVITPNADQIVVTITENSGTATYDGTEHTVTGYSVTSISSRLYTAADFKFIGTEAAQEVKGINAGSYDMNLKASDFQNINDQFSNVKFVIVDGKLNISKRPVTLTSASASRPYDGTELTNGTVTVGGEGFVTGEGATFDVTGKIKNVGKVDNAFTYTLNNGTDKENYEITKKTGELEITPVVTEVTVTITGAVTTDTYDGTEKAAEGYKVSIDNALYTEKDFSFNGEAIAKKTNAGTKQMGLAESNFENTSKNFTNVKFVVHDGKVVINRRNVTLTSATDSKQYDGKPLTKKEVTVGGDGFAEGEGATYDVTGSQTKVGSSDNAFTYVLKDNTKAENYNITPHEGTLTVTNRDAKYNVKLVANSNTGNIYDGSEKSAKGIQTDEFEIDGVKYKVSGYQTSDPAETDAGTYDNVITGTYKVMDPEGNDVTNQFAVATENGKLKIAKRKVTLTSATDNKQYDGKSLTKKEVTVTGDGFAEGEGAVFNVTGSQTLVGESDNTYEYTLNSNTKEKNYDITKKVGTLTVTDRETKYDIKVKANSKDTVYDGTEQTVDGFEQTTFVVDGNTYKVSGINASAKGTDQGRYKTTITGTPVVTDAAGNDVTSQFKVDVIEGQLNIAKRDITITAGSAQAVYNGRALTKNTSEITAGTLAVGDSYTATIEGSQLYVGSSGNIIKTVTITADKAGQKRDVTDNYNVTLVPGNLTVTDGTPEIPVDPSLVVNKTHEGKAEGGDFKSGDVITFTIKVKNIYDEVKTITLEEQAGVTLDQAVFENVQPGAEITATATYTVTEADLVNGTFTNNVTARFSGVDKEYPGTDTVEELEDPRPHMTITKKTTGAEDGHIYKLGETINYEITVKNDGNLTLTNVTVEDALTGNTGENVWTIPTLAPGAEQTFTASYEVTEADVLAGKVVNNATGTAENPDPDQPETPVVPGEKEDPTETPNPSLFVEKAASDAPEGGFAVGDEITYTITVTNNGNVTVKDIKVTDKLTGNTGDKAFTVDKLAPGKSKTFTAKYTVTEADVVAGKIENVATAAGKDPEGKDVTGEGKEEVVTEESTPHIIVTKETTSTPKNGETYALGEEITYKITVKNDGNLTLTNVTVEDALTGNTGDKAFKIDGEFKPGDKKTFKATYTVTEADLGKTVVNVATATGKTPDPDKPEPGVTPGKTEDPTDSRNPSMSITKKVVDPKKEYEIGDTVKYEITVENTGNTTQSDILVEDQMSNAAGQAVITKVDGAKGAINGTNVTLDTLAPGAKATIEVEYTVVKADRGNRITNAAVAKGEGEEPKTPEVPVDVENVYDIHVVHAFAPGNEGNVALPDDYTIENLKPGTVQSLMAEGVTGYVAYPAVQSATVIDRDITVTFLYYKDEIGTDPTNPDKPDGVPDEFQAVVRFAAVNGSVSIDHAVVTLFGEDGKPAKNGVGHLSALQIAAATANDGYDQSSLSWAPAVPTTTYDITGEMTFTATFTATPATPVTPPTTPDNPNPTNPTTPSGQTTEPTGNAFVDNVVTPVVEAVKEKVAQIQEVFNSDDDGVPLANQNLDNHKCCILHFLIMLITLLAYALATKSMKNRQKKLHEAREELDCELARRGLPLSSEKE